MLPHNSMKLQQAPKPSSTKHIATYLEKIVSFIDWSELENETLHKFQQLLTHELKISKQQVRPILAHFRIDHQLHRSLLKMCDEISHNLHSFHQHSQNLAQYHSLLQSQALHRVHILVRTSCPEVTHLCNSLAFLHFGSCHMDQYNAMIHWFEGRGLGDGLATGWGRGYACGLRARVYSVIGILYVKFGMVGRRRGVVEAGVAERERYLEYRRSSGGTGGSKSDKSISSNTVSNGTISNYSYNYNFSPGQSDRLIELISQSVLNININDTERTLDNNPNAKLQNHNPISTTTCKIPTQNTWLIQFEIITIFLRCKLIEGLVSGNGNGNGNLYEQSGYGEVKGKGKDGDNENGNGPEKYQKILALIYKYVGEIKAKREIEGIRIQLEYFNTKMEEFIQICNCKIREFDDNLYQNQPKQNQISDFTNKKPRKYHKVSSSTLKPQKQTKSKSLDIKKSRSSSAHLLKFHTSSASTTKKPMKQQLEQLYFKNNNKQQKQRHKSKSAKVVMLRDRSKSKIMAKILANTFENAKNALRQIQFQIKTNNFDRFIMTKQSADNPKSTKLLKKKKNRNQIYQKLAQTNKTRQNITRSSLLDQISALSDLRICNPFTLIEQNKKCIIDHKVSHKDPQQINMQMMESQLMASQILQIQQEWNLQEMEGDKGKQDGMLRSEIQSKLEFIKYISGIPHKFAIRIKTKEKNYLLSLAFHPHSQQQFTIQISLPKSNNIYTGRYHTIWPTIKYLLRKKLLQHPVIKEYESRLFETRNTGNNQQERHCLIKEEKLLGIFGAIEEDEFYEITSTIGLVCKFYGLVMFWTGDMLGGRWEVCEFYRGIGNKQDIQDSCNSNGSSCETDVKIKLNGSAIGLYRSPQAILNTIKTNMWLASNKDIYLGAAFIKQRYCTFMGLKADSQFPFFVYQIASNTDYLAKGAIGEGVMRLEVRVWEVCRVGSVGKKSSLRAKGGLKEEIGNGQIGEKKRQYICMEKIQFSSIQLLKYGINFSTLLQKIKSLLRGTKIDQITQQKLLQICWQKFSKADNFYTPSFFNSFYPTIRQPCAVRVDSDSLYRLADTSTNGNGNFNAKIGGACNGIKVCENFLEFNLDELAGQNSSQFFTRQNTHRTVVGNKKSEVLDRKTYSCNLHKIPSINIELGKINSYNIVKYLNPTSIQNSMIRYSLCTGKNINKKQLIEIKFLTPLSYFHNWIVQIAIIDLLKRYKNAITLSAQDFYSLGFVNKGHKNCNGGQIIKEIVRLSNMLEFSHCFAVPKIVIVLKPKQNGNVSNQSGYGSVGYREGRVGSVSSSQNSSEQSSKAQINTIFQYRSLFHNRRSISHNFLQYIGPNLRAVGALSKPQVGPSSCIIRKRRSSNISSHQKEQNSKTAHHNHGFQSPKVQQHQYLPYSLISMHNYVYYLCQVPIKLILLPSETEQEKNISQSRKIFGILHMKYLKLEGRTGENDEGRDLEKGILEFQVTLSQTQYTMVGQIKYIDFLTGIEKIHPRYAQNLYRLLIFLKINPQSLSSTTPVNPKKPSSPLIKRRQSLKSKNRQKSPVINSTLNKNVSYCVKSDRFTQQDDKKEQDSMEDCVKMEDINMGRERDRDREKNIGIYEGLYGKCKKKAEQFGEDRTGIKEMLLNCRVIANEEPGVRGYDPPFSLYTLSVANLSVPLKIRLLHHYDHEKKFIHNIYMECQKWRFGLGVNEGAGYGAELEVSRIDEEDSFQLVKISEGEDDNKGQHEQQLANMKILDLLRMFKLELVDPACQMQPDLYTRDTVLLTRLAAFMLGMYVHQ